MKATTIALIRHGAYHQPAGVPSALLPHPLTEEGFEQAKAGAFELKSLLDEQGLQLNKEFFSSSALRAYQTALTIKETLNLKEDLISNDALCERSVGAMANLTVSEIEEVLKKDPRFDLPAPGWKSTPDYKLPYPGAESLLEAGLRVANFIKEKAKSNREDSCTVFVGHGASIRFACYHLGLWSIETAKAHSMYYGRPILLKLEENKLTTLAGTWKIRDMSRAPKD